MITATIAGSVKTFSVIRLIKAKPLPDYKCSTREWKPLVTKAVKLDYGKTEEVTIGTELVDDITKKSWSDRCPTKCEVLVTSEAPVDLFKYKEGKLTIGPAKPEFKGKFDFTISRKGGTHPPTSDTFSVTFIPIVEFKGIKVEVTGATATEKVVTSEEKETSF